MSRIFRHDFQWRLGESFRLFSLEIDWLISGVGNCMIASMNAIFGNALSGICVDWSVKASKNWGKLRTAHYLQANAMPRKRPDYQKTPHFLKSLFTILIDPFGPCFWVAASISPASSRALRFGPKDLEHLYRLAKCFGNNDQHTRPCLNSKAL